MAEKSKRKTYLIFISHSEKDRWIAKQMASLIDQRCRTHSVKTFLYEKHIVGGESIPESIRKNIQECGEFLVLLTRYSIDRPWVLIEIGAAWALEKRITAIIDQVAPQEMPDIITQYKAIDLNSFDQYLEQLFARIREARK